MEARNRIIVALDVDTREHALSLVGQLSGRAGLFKIGSQLFTAAGPQLVREVIGLGEKVFLDLKFHDIPNTVEKAVLAAADLGVSMLTLHASGGEKMMRGAAKAARQSGSRPLLLGVTVLTSLAQEDLAGIGFPGAIASQVERLAVLARDCGMDGVVAAPSELELLRARLSPAMRIVTPGIRPAGAAIDDQSRISTPSAALRAGADYLVIGRPITASPNPLLSFEQILHEAQDNAAV